MGRPPRPSLEATALVFLGILAVVFVSAPGSAFHQGTATPVSGLVVQETRTLPVDNWTGYTFTLGSGDTLVYQIAAGDQFDVYFVSDEALADYASDTALQFLPYRSIENTFVAQGTLQVSQSQAGHVTVVVDNVDITIGGATPTGPLMVTVQLTRTVAPSPFGGISPLLIGGIIGAIILVVIIAVAVAMSRRKKALPPPAPVPPAAAPGYPGYQYPPSPPPYQQPPQQGWPPQPPPPGNP